MYLLNELGVEFKHYWTEIVQSFIKGNQSTKVKSLENQAQKWL